jgi:hypothetical protein
MELTSDAPPPRLVDSAKASVDKEESSHLEESNHIGRSSHIKESIHTEESSHHIEESSHHIEESSHTEAPSQKPDDGESSPEGGESSPDEESSQLGGLLTDLRLPSLYSECESGYDESPSECDLHEEDEDDEQERGRARGRRRAREDMEPFTDEGRVSVESGGGEEDSLASTEDLPSSQQTLLDRWDRREIIV